MLFIADADLPASIFIHRPGAGREIKAEEENLVGRNRHAVQ